MPFEEWSAHGERRGSQFPSEKWGGVPVMFVSLGYNDDGIVDDTSN